MIDDQLFGKTRAGVLREVYLNPDKRISFNELVRRLRTGDGAVSRELKNLLAMGLLSEEREGSHRFLRASKASPLYREMKALVSKASGPARILKEALRELEDKLEVAFIFGSVAKGVERSDSDLDLFVIGTAGYSEVMECVHSVEKRLGRRAQVLYYNSESQADRASLRKPSVHALLAGPRRFVVGSERSLEVILTKRKLPLVNRRNLDNLTRGARPSLHTAEPNWDVLRGLVDRAEQAIVDAGIGDVGLPTRFASAYSAASWLARTALEAAGYRLAGTEGNRTMAFQCLAHAVEWENEKWRRLDDLHRFRNRFDYGDIVDVSEAQVETLIADAQDLLQRVRETFPDLDRR